MSPAIEWLLDQPAPLVFLLLALMAATENVFPPVPADVAAALGAFWAAENGRSPWLLGFVCFAANQVSAMAVYFWARARGEAVLTSPLFASLLPAEDREPIRRRVEAWGAWGVFLSRFMPGLRAAVLPFAAIYGLSPARALLPAAVASLLWYALLTAAGASLGLAYKEVATLVNRSTGFLGAVALAVTAVLIWSLWKRGRTKRG
jgi:membrane protein DedA with SNARE-associated domain